MPQLGLGIGIGSSNKSISVYRATGTGLSPDINNIVFYQTDTFNGRPLYFNDSLGYYLWYLTGANFWVVNKTKISGTGWSQTVGQGASPTNATYAAQPGATGTVTIVAV